MIPDLAWWGQLFGLLATEAALLVALAAAGARWSRSAHWRRLIWQSAFMAVALVWSVELAGGRGWLAQWRPVPEPPRQVMARVVGDTPVGGEQVTFEFPAEVPVVAPAQRQEPRWWPGFLWLGGMLALLLKTLGSRAWLAWRIRAVPGHEVGQAASLPTGAASARLAACPTLAEALPAEGGDLDGLADVTATVTRLRPALGVGPVRLVTWPQLRSPVAFGIVRPTVAVPAEFAERFPPAQREAMLAHELGHLAQRDPLWLLVADLVCALAWWHPAVWWARRQFRASCEAAADEASALIPGGRVALAEALVNFGRELTAPGGVGVGGSGLRSELARRVKALVERAGEARPVRSAARWGLQAGTASLLLGLLAAPWPGELNGLVPVMAAARAQQTEEKPPYESVKDMLADPQFREVVKSLDDATAQETNEAPTGNTPNRAEAEPAISVGAVTPTRGHPLVPQIPHPVPGEFQNTPYRGPYGTLRLATAPVATVRLEPLRAVTLLHEKSVEEKPALDSKFAYALPQTGRQESASYVVLRSPELLTTRQFRLSAADFTAHLQQFLPQGETNAQALQLAVRAFCATNGIEFPAMVANASGVTPPQDQPAIFYNDRTGVLFARATLENLDRLEHAIQRLNLLPLAASNKIGDSVVETNPLKAATPLNAGSLSKNANSVVATEQMRSLGEDQVVGLILQCHAELEDRRATLGDGHPEVEAKTRNLVALQRQLDAMRRATQRMATPSDAGALSLNSDSVLATEQQRFAALEQLTQQLVRYQDRLEKGRATYGDDHPEVMTIRANVIALQTQYDALQASQGAATPSEAGVMLTRQFRVDSAKFIPRVMTDFDPAAEAARRLDSIPNRGLIASDVGAAVSSVALPGVAGIGTTNGPHLGEAIHAYFRKHGVDFPLSTSQGVTGAVAPERPAVFFKTDSGILFVRATLEDMAKLESALAGLESQVAASSGNQSPQVELSVTLVEIADGGSDDVGLDWLFGQAATNNPPVVSALATNLPGSAGALQGNRLTVDRLAVEGQSAVLSGEQFAALRERLGTRNQVDFLSAPKVITLSGRQAQVSIAEVRTLVTGVVAENGSTTNDAGIRYLTESVPVGPVVDLFPLAAGDAWQVRVVAAVTEFLGYDQPAKSDRVRATTAEGKVLPGTTPLPRLRVRETQSTVTAKVGEVIALRGPLAETVVRYKDKVPVLGDVPLLGRLFRKEGSQVQRKRLYVFVQPETIDAQGNRPLSK